ncbi:MAG: methyl-accepting chemotaxis protein [Candidatus Acidiferrales bacterium]
MKMTLGKKIGAGFGLILLLMIGVAVAGYWGTHKTSSAMIDLLQTDAELEEQFAGARINALDMRRYEKDAVLDIGKPADQADALDKWKSTDERFHERIAALTKIAVTNEDKDALGVINGTLKVYEDGFAALVAKLHSGEIKRVKDANADTNSYRNAVARMADTLQMEDAEHGSRIMDRRQLADVTNKRTLLILLAAVLGGVIVGGIVSVAITRRITKPIALVVCAMQRILHGDLTGEALAITSKDEMGELGDAANEMQRSLRAMIGSVSISAERIATASEEFSATASEQAQGAQAQKDQTHQVAAAMQEMSSTVAQVAENSNKASEASRKAADTARLGGQIVEDTLTKMHAIADSVGHTAKRVQELGRSSNQIGEIIGVIDDIADQTNLLALNAAIEAARAGEQGRGFAVVADEVRKLAERTSKATKEITKMIQNIQTETQSAVEAMQVGTQQVALGVESTTQAGNSLHEIIKTSELVGDMILLIATAATEQSSASEEINANIEQIAKITQETAAGSQESAKAVHELSNLATNLYTLVGKFRVNSNGTSKHATRTRPSDDSSCSQEREQDQERYDHEMAEA